MAGVVCPTCGSKDYLRFRQPINLADVTFRRHRCQQCRGLFFTAQVAISGTIATKLLTLTELPTTSSALTPSDAASSPLTLLQQMQGADSTPTTGASD